MAAQMASVSISSPSPPLGNDSGILSRLLRRATSTKGSTRSRRRRSANKQQDNLSDQNLTEPTDGALLGAVGDPAPQQLLDLNPLTASQDFPQTGSSITTTEPQLHQQRLPSSQEPTPDMLAELAQPRLRKKASFRDRLKSWQKPGQTTVTKTAAPFNDQPKRFVYQPQHAAADFSRMAISPAAAPAPRKYSKLSFDEDSTLSPSVEQVDARHAIQVLDEEADLVKSRRADPPLQTLVENEMVADGHAQARHGKQKDDSMRVDARDFTLQRSRSGARRSYKMVEDPWMASQAAAHVPIGTLASRSLSTKNRTRESPLQLDAMDAPLIEKQEKSPAQKEALSDFERFLAQAEAEDRAQREQILRSISHHSTFQPSSANYVKPNPHRQFVTVGGGNMSGTTAGPGLVSTGGSRSSRGGSQRTSGQYALSAGREEQPFRPGHRKQTSWTPSFGAGSDNIEKPVERTRGSQDTGGSNTWGPPPMLASRTRRPQPPQPQTVVYGVDESFNQPEPVRTLRRKASITQRIADYIKPEREPPAAGGAEQGLRRSASKSGLRTSGSRRRPTGIETLVE